MAQSLVLFIFSSNALLEFVVRLGLPPYPLIPVSSSQAVIGAVIGIGMTYGLPGVRQIKWRVLLNISSGWVLTPLIAAGISFFFLFFLQNVFQQQVFKEVRYALSDPVIERLAAAGVKTSALEDLRGKEIVSAAAFRDAVRERAKLSQPAEKLVIESARDRPNSGDLGEARRLGSGLPRARPDRRGREARRAVVPAQMAARGRLGAAFRCLAAERTPPPSTRATTMS